MREDTYILMQLQKYLDEERYLHSLGVKNCAVELAKRYGGDIYKAELAGLIHDCAKCISFEDMIKKSKDYGLILDKISMKEKELIHGPLGAKIAEYEFGVKDKEILSAIECHTVGKPNMSLLDKIIYLADLIEPNRSYPGVRHLRDTSMVDINRAVLEAFDNAIKYVLSLGSLLHLDTVEARNDILLFLL